MLQGYPYVLEKAHSNKPAYHQNQAGYVLAKKSHTAYKFYGTLLPDNWWSNNDYMCYTCILRW